MTKDEALTMAIETMENIEIPFRQYADKAINACKEALETPVCNPHPLAPHGFNRNGSHNAGRYVCDCEGWEFEWQGLTDDEIEEIMDCPVDAMYSGDYETCRDVEAKLKEKNTS